MDSLDKKRTQGRIKNLVRGYKELFPEEYKELVQVVKENRESSQDDFGTTNTKTLERAIHEISDTLDGMFMKELSEAELLWFRSKEGGRWFAKTFNEFSLVNKI